MADDPAMARRMWVLLEAVHSVTYFAPEARAAHEAVGLRGFWRGYFAMRAAPLGPVGSAVVVAVFHDEWAAATNALQARHLLDRDGGLTPQGTRLREDVEARTDQLSAPSWQALSSDEIAHLDGTLGPLAARVAHGPVPYPNPIGAPRPG